jgi:DNA replication ATP-dependent helicase Dna2
MSINKLLEVEEKVWSPLYGLKGNVDATVQMCLKNVNEVKTLTVPFELKTGKHQSAAHKAQTSLYTLLLSDRYGMHCAHYLEMRACY